MPQMSPLFWLGLFILFISSLAYFCIVSYFIPVVQKTNQHLMNNLVSQKSWKW
uniref:ATP synthase F0 subunit 8 n=1 Tax=Linuparus trigonus TaxID=198218 RepID=A0A7D3U8Y9_9EUCA|nr:ATP synthase F0 subunit 8 [Linuparus trigonus]QKE42649.1 ATP synthase F0 subunit 8 [Linuparus trigonus]